MSALAFLSPGPGAVAKSPMEPGTVAAGRDHRAARRLERGHRVPRRGALARRRSASRTSRTLGKLEIQGDVAAITGHDLELGRALRADGAWWCPYSAERAVVLCSPNDTAALRDRLLASAAGANGLASVIDTTTSQGAMTILGPLARETFARFTAIDLRPQVTPVHAFRPGSVARTGGAILCEAPDRYLMLFGAALGQYVWTLVADAAGHLGGGPVGVDALEPLDA